MTLPPLKIIYAVTVYIFLEGFTSKFYQKSQQFDKKSVNLENEYYFQK
jgi:hypothetical protein